MADNDKVVGLVVGFGLGFASAYLLIKSGTIAVTLDQTKTQRKYNAMDEEKGRGPNPLANFNPLANWKPLKEIPNLANIDLALDEIAPLPITEIEDTTSALQSSSGTTYKNSEKWKILRDKNNRIVGYELDRNAKVG